MAVWVAGLPWSKRWYDFRLKMNYAREMNERVYLEALVDGACEVVILMSYLHRVRLTTCSLRRRRKSQLSTSHPLVIM